VPAIRAILVWGGVGAAIAVAFAVAAASPLLAWRDPVYVAACFAGIAGMAVMAMQPLLVAGYLPGLAGQAGRRVHRVGGALLVAVVIAHVAGLWFTSPPDVVDALIFASPAPFSAWGVIAMWAVFAATLLAALRRRIGIRPRSWRLAHSALAVVIVAGSVAHALLVEGIMGTLSKAALCLLAAGATLKALHSLKAWRKTLRQGS
jgi:predicted ferric reductase